MNGGEPVTVLTIALPTPLELVARVFGVLTDYYVDETLGVWAARDGLRIVISGDPPADLGE